MVEENTYFMDISTRINEIEEKQRLLKDRILLIGENLISTKEDLLNLEGDYRREMKNLTTELSSIKRLISRIVNELSTTAKKSEVEILERQFKMFQPLESNNIKDIKNLIKKEILKYKK